MQGNAATVQHSEDRMGQWGSIPICLRCERGKVVFGVMQADGNRVLQRPAYKDLEGKGSVAEQAEEAWTLTRRSSSSVIEDLFAGQLMSTLTCPDCGAQSHCFTEVLDLSLPLLRGRELNTIQVGSC